MIFNSLVHGDVQEIVFNSEVGTGSVHSKTFLVVHQDNLRLEFLIQFTQKSFFTHISIKSVKFNLAIIVYLVE